MPIRKTFSFKIVAVLIAEHQQTWLKCLPLLPLFPAASHFGKSSVDVKPVVTLLFVSVIGMVESDIMFFLLQTRKLQCKKERPWWRYKPPFKQKANFLDAPSPLSFEGADLVPGTAGSRAVNCVVEGSRPSFYPQVSSQREFLCEAVSALIASATLHYQGAACL